MFKSKALKFWLMGFAVLFATAYCGQKEMGTFYLGSAGFDTPKIILTSSNSGLSFVAMYDIDGNFVNEIANYRPIGGYAAGVAKHDAFNIISAVYTLEQYDKLSLFGGRSPWAQNASISGTYRDIILGPDNYYYSIVGNTIERLSYSGIRDTSAGGVYIATSVGGCTLSTPFQLDFNSSRQLVVTNNSGDILTYNVIGGTASCVSSVSVGNNPSAVLAHSNGNLYFGQLGNDTINVASIDGSGSSAIYNNSSVIDGPTTMVEHPDGSLIIASSNTQEIIKISTAGTFQRVFIKSTFSWNVADILVLGE